MLNRFSKLISVLGLTTISAINANSVSSQETYTQSTAPPPVSIDVIRPGSPLNLNELINKASSENSGDFFEQSSILGQLNFIFGWRDFPEGSYSENSMSRDLMLINAIQQDFFKQIAEREPTIRTRDIPNPFDTSILQSPIYIKE